MKEYDKEKLNEYAKELFALCLEKGLPLKIEGENELFLKTNKVKYTTYLSKELYKFKLKNIWSEDFLPIWELIEKVKEL